MKFEGWVFGGMNVRRRRVRLVREARWEISNPGSRITDFRRPRGQESFCRSFSFVQHEPESLMLISIKLEYVYKWHITVLNSVNMYFHKYFAISYL